jgi:NADPH:quinone reductase-like Zn-dependent oxidoreductase
MKAIVFNKYGSPDVIQLKEIEKPTPKDNEVLVKVHASSVTTADSMIRQGNPCYGRLFLGLKKHKKPIAGTGFAGVIEQVGNNVTQFSVGDSVFGETGMDFSSNAEYLCISEDAVITSLVKNMSYQEATSICDGALTSYAFLKDIGNLKRGQSILINGASGSLGSAAIQIAKHLGAEVTGVCSTANIEMVKSLGADYVIDYLKEDFTKTNARYDIVYDSVGKNSFSKSKASLKQSGVYLSPVLSFPLLIQMLWSSKFGNKKAKFSATGLRPAIELRKLLAELKVLFETGEITSVIDRQYPLAETADAHRYVDLGHKKGNVVINMEAFLI